MSNGCTIDLTQGCRIGVDYWSSRAKDLQACFLTHAHTDHTQGLSERWAGQDIHCTEKTKQILINKWPQLEPKLVVVTIGDTLELVLKKANGSHVRVNITPIDACHCPGSVMYLFEGVFGTILHTGDFRWEPDEGRSTLPEILLNGPIDRLYMDNTYCNPKYNFPSRATELEVIKETVRLNPEFRIVIGMDKLGKEEIVEEVSKVSGEQVGVTPERARTLEIAGVPDTCCTTNMKSTRITVMPKWEVKQDVLAATKPPSIGIIPSSLFRAPHQAARKLSLQSWKKQDLRVCVPYSLHSCFLELQDFVEQLQPREIIGIVKRSGDLDMNPRMHFSHLLMDTADDDECTGLESDTHSLDEGLDRGTAGELPSGSGNQASYTAMGSTGVPQNSTDAAASTTGFASKRSWRPRYSANGNRSLKIVSQQTTLPSCPAEDDTENVALQKDCENVVFPSPTHVVLSLTARTENKNKPDKGSADRENRQRKSRIPI